MSALADLLYNCPAGLECGPCRRRIGLLIEVADRARAFHEAYNHSALYQREEGDAELLGAALAALDADTQKAHE